MVQNRRKREKGNALFLILIAVALFAALGYAITQSSRGGGKNADAEKLSLQAAQIVQYAGSIKFAIDRMRYGWGYRDTEISFENSTVAGYTNANCTSTDCKVFDTAGGGVAYDAPKEEWLDSSQSAQALYGEWYFPVGVCIPFVGTGETGCQGDGLDNEELVLILPYVRKALCLEINDRLGITNSGGNPPNRLLKKSLKRRPEM